MSEIKNKAEKKSKATQKASDQSEKKEYKSETYTSTSSSKSSSQDVSNTPTYNNRVTRNENDKILGGVASGIARYINVDPLIIRLAFVALILERV